MNELPIDAVKNCFLELQDSICASLAAEDGDGTRKDKWREDTWTRADDKADGEGGGGRSRILEGGETFEKAGVNFSHVFGDALPPAASAARPELAAGVFRHWAFPWWRIPSTPGCRHPTPMCACSWRNEQGRNPSGGLAAALT